MSSTLTQLVTVFNGSGYNAWAEKMMVYLDFQGLSMIVNGELDQPTVPTSGNNPRNNHSSSI